MTVKTPCPPDCPGRYPGCGGDCEKGGGNPPHGDLIDRDALINNKYATFTIEEEGLWGMYRDKGVWLSAVENVPTIIQASEEAE